MINIKIKKPNKKTFLLTLFLALISFLAFLTENNNIELFVVTLAFVVILIRAKVSYFTIFSFIMWFSFLQEYFASVSRRMAAGRLKWDYNVPIYYKELYICLIFFYIFELILFDLTKVIDNEKQIYKQKIEISKNTMYLYSTISFCLIFLAYPSIPTMNTLLSRDKGIVSSSLFVPIALLFLSITIDYFKKNHFIKIITIIDMVWVILHGDRVIVLGFCVYLILKYMNDGQIKLNKIRNILFNKKTVVVTIGIIVAILLSLRVQTTRIGNSYSVNIVDLGMSILKQGTAADVVHCFNCATDMWKNGTALHGYTYISYISNILPKANESYNPSLILMKKYNTLGGGLFFTEPMMNGGIILCIVHSMIFLLILVWLFSKKTKYRSYMVIPFAILIFRFAWYASLAGLVKMLIYYVPILYFTSKILK